MPSFDENGGSGVTNKELSHELRDVHDVVVSIQSKIDLVAERLVHTQENIKDHESDSDEIHRDHEKRLRQLERWRYALPGGAVLIVITLAIGLFALFVHH